MPLYEYECEACGHRFEVIQKFSDPPIEKCPVCGGAVHKRQSAPAFQFKGSGWYVTDYAKAGKAGEKAEGAEGSKSDGKTEGQAESKGESKEGSKAETKEPAAGPPGSKSETSSPPPTSTRSSKKTDD